MASLGKNYLFNLSYQLFSLLIPLITVPYVSRVLGAEQIGVYNFIMTSAGYFVLLGQFGLSLYGQRRIAELFRDQGAQARTFTELVLLRLLFFVPVLLAYVVYIWLNDEFQFYALCFVPYLFAAAVDISWFYQGRQQFKFLTIRNFIVRIVCTVLIFTLVHKREDLWIYMLLVAIAQFLSQASLWISVRPFLVYVKFSWKIIQSHVVGGWAFFMPAVITSFYTMADKLMLGMLASQTQLGLYAQSEQAIKMSLALIGSMGTVVMPRMTNLYAERDFKAIRNMLDRTQRWCFFIALPMIAMIIGVAPNFVSWFFGPGFEDVAPLMMVISPIILMIGLSDVYGMQYLLPTNQTRAYTIATVIGAIVNMMLNLLLIRQWQAIGASIATVVAELSVTTTMYVYMRQTLQLSVKLPREYVMASIFMLVLIWSIELVLQGGILLTLIQIIVGGSYIGMCCIMKDRSFYMIRDLWRKMTGFRR